MHPDTKKLRVGGKGIHRPRGRFNQSRYAGLTHMNHLSTEWGRAYVALNR